MSSRPRSVLVQIRATILAAIAACAIVGLPTLRAIHAAEHAGTASAAVAAAPAMVPGAADHDEALCFLCQTLSAADQPLTPQTGAPVIAPVEIGSATFAVAAETDTPRFVPVHGDARAPPRG